MKKAIVTVFAVAMVILLCACSKPSNVVMAKSKTIYICDKYLNFEITKGETIEMLDDLSSRLSDSELSELCLKNDIGYLKFLLSSEYVDAHEVDEKIEYIRNTDYSIFSK